MYKPVPPTCGLLCPSSELLISSSSSRRNCDSAVLLGQVHTWLQMKINELCSNEAAANMALLKDWPPARWTGPAEKTLPGMPQGRRGFAQLSNKKVWSVALSWGTEMSGLVCGTGAGLLSGFFPPNWAYLAEVERHKLMPCSFSGGCTPQPTFHVLLQLCIKKSPPAATNVCRMYHMQNVPFLWLKRYNGGYHVTDEGKYMLQNLHAGDWFKLTFPWPQGLRLGVLVDEWYPFARTLENI